MIRRVVIFGASGDLTSRYLLPALVQLDATGCLPEELQILGVAREAWDTETFRRHIAVHLQRQSADVTLRSRQAVTAKLTYRQADVTDSSQVARAIDPSGGPLVAYLALPPSMFAPTIEALAAIGLPEECRIVIEKPFGANLAAARALNQLLHQKFPEHAVFRIDHFLGKQTVQNVLGIRFANRVFEPLWNSHHIQRVEIIWDETLALEGRATYYDTAGALKDMLQNHLLQLLCLVGMEPPRTLHERDFRDRKVDVLRAVRRLSPAEIMSGTVRGRYGAGRIGDRVTPAYVDEQGVDPQRGTETFAQVRLLIDNWRWAGVPFFLRSGKALGRDRREIAIHFKPVPYLAFGPHPDPQPNVLRLQLDPDRVSLGVNINGPGDPFTLEWMELDMTLAPQSPPAYGRLLLDVLDGDPTLFIRDDEAEESWQIIEPISALWAENKVPLLEYPAGSHGPEPPDTWQ